ncbi:uncharacterized protein [Triticum aestivum]|uniref:uncharacterized protein n=1 Tax=Triticum aestivum TaxID=4565 RepID=UPI001D02F90D|nr:uncharacterized protein LOC123066203 [Triticum aestivum]
MKAADQSHAPPVPRPFRRAKQPSTTSRHEGEGGGADRRRRPSRRGGTSKRGRGRPHHLLRPCSSNWGATRARTGAAAAAAALNTSNQDLSSTCAHIQILPSRGCDDDSNPRGKLSPSTCAQIQIVPSRGCDDELNPRKKHLLRPSLSIIQKRGRRRPHHLLRPCSSQPDDSKIPGQKHMLRPCLSIQPPPNYCWGAKRSRTNNNNWRDWSNLDDGPLGLIAERVLAFDVTDYLRFRAVCRPWRHCSTEPHTHGGLDRRFHPWRWVLLREPLAAPNRRCFLNSFTGEFIQVDLPELLDHELLAVTPEGLLVLFHDHNHVRLLNPLTRHVTELPPLTTLLPSKHHVMLSYFNIDDFLATGSGIASDDSTVVLCFNRFRILGMAKPGDDHWILLKYNHDGFTHTPLMFAGRFYYVKVDGVMALQICPNQPPRLEVAAKLNMHVSPISEGLHLVNSCGDLMLIHRQTVPLTSLDKSCYQYDMYRVNLDTGTLLPVKSLGGGAGRAMFWGMHCSFSVPLEVFPSGSISADTIYPSFDFTERSLLEVGAYHLLDGHIDRPSGLLQRPNTLVDCLSLSNTVDDE